MIIGISMDQEICQILGQVSLSLLYEVRNLQKDICGLGERLTKTASDIQARSFHGQNSGEDWQEMPSLGRSINGQLKKPKLDNAGRLRGIHFIDPEDKEFKQTIKNARRKLETPMAPAMPCKTCKNKQAWMERPVARLMISSLNLRVSWKPVNPQECVWKNLYQHIMRTISAGKGDNSLQHYNLVHKFNPMPQAMKIPAAKAAVG